MKNSKNIPVLEKKILPFVLKPGRYIGNEINSIVKEIRPDTLRFAIAFPDVYDIGMSSQAVGILYHLLNRIEFVWAERVFAPWHDMEQRLIEHQLPLYSLESFTPLNEFDIIGFTLQYELTYTNILNMLRLAGIPILAAERESSYPLILGGGPCSCNPEPVADFFDAILIGDAEEALPEICHLVRQNKNKISLLKKLAGLPGIYIPAFYQPVYYIDGKFGGLNVLNDAAAHTVQTRIAPDLKTEYLPEKPLVPLVDITHNRLAVEIMRGCTEGCRYCNAGMVYRPVRERPADQIADYTEDMVLRSGFDEVSLLSLSTSDYSGLSRLISRERYTLSEQRVNVSLPSLRLDSFSEEIASFASEVRKSGFTFAPEAGTESLRRVINKNISDDDLLNSVQIALEFGWRTLKFYFMIGLPTETEEDIRGIVDLMKRVLAKCEVHRKVNLHVSVSPFSPKSHTPFQWERQNTTEEFLIKINLLREHFQPIKQIKFTWRDPAVSRLECILGRGDRRLATVIEHAWRNGCKFDGWDEHFSYDKWEAAFRANDIQPANYQKEIPLSQALPWDHIDKGISRQFLRDERIKAYSGITTQDCRTGRCVACGVQRLEKTCSDQAHQKPDRKHSKSIPTSQKQFEPTWDHFRVQFKKDGFARFLSHLDVMRAFERAARRAQIRLAYREGFNPRPKFSFGPALQLGFTSEAEYFDLEACGIPASDLKEKLNTQLPPGLMIRAIKPIGHAVKSLTSVINTNDYVITLSDLNLDEKVVPDLLARDEILIVRRNKNREKTINIRPYIQQIFKSDGSLFLRSCIINQRSVRPGEILNILIDPSQSPSAAIPVHRKAQYINADGRLSTPLDII